MLRFMLKNWSPRKEGTLRQGSIKHSVVLLATNIRNRDFGVVINPSFLVDYPPVTLWPNARYEGRLKNPNPRLLWQVYTRVQYMLKSVARCN